MILGFLLEMIPKGVVYSFLFFSFKMQLVVMQLCWAIFAGAWALSLLNKHAGHACLGGCAAGDGSLQCMHHGA
jgi:hypothetical protein